MIPLAVAGLGCVAAKTREGDGLEALARQDPADVAGFFRRHKVRLRVAELISASARPDLQQVARQLAPHAAVARARQQTCDEVIADLDAAGRELGFAVFGLKGLVSRTFYPDARLRDLGDTDVFLSTGDDAWRLARWIRERGWDYDERELPWFKGDPKTGAAYGQIRLTKSRDNCSHFVDIHYGGYSIRHCGLYRFSGLPGEPGWHLIPREQNLVATVANAAGDDFITLKDLNDLYFAWSDPSLDIRQTYDHLRKLELARFFATMTKRLDELFDLSALPSPERVVRTMTLKPEPSPPLAAPVGRLRWRVTVTHAFRTGKDQSIASGVVAAITAARYYSSRLRLHARSRSWRTLRLPPFNSRTCVRLVPVGLALRRLGAMAATPPSPVRLPAPQTQPIDGFQLLRAGRISSGYVLFAGDEAFIPTVYYDISRALLDEISSLQVR
jgi:hypothetical protein